MPSASLAIRLRDSDIQRMKQLDVPNDTEAGESPIRTLRIEKAKATPGWVDTVIWVVIILSWGGFTYLAFSVH